MSEEEKASEWEQQIREMAEAAAALWRLFTACRAQGFSEDQALKITLTFMTAHLKDGDD